MVLLLGVMVLVCVVVPVWVVVPGCGPSERRDVPVVPGPAVRGADVSSSRVFIPIEAEPTYHLLAGYDPRWQAQVREGVEMARQYWGSYGPAHVWVVGTEDGQAIGDDAKEAFLGEYCRWRISGTDRTMDDCRGHATERFIDVAERGESEAYLSWVDEFDQPEAELVFINVDQWYFEDDPIPDPILRGIHECTHVFQKAFGVMPTWMMEGGAVFSEAWIPWIEGRCDYEFLSMRMRHLLDRIEEMEDSDLTIADMEDIDSAPESVRKYYRELAYDAGAWAFVFLVHQSPSASVSTLRDEFFPMITEHGWEKAMSLYLGIPGKAEFYEAFDGFMGAPLRTKLVVLRELQP